jgi:hypothetical protein
MEESPNTAKLTLTGQELKQQTALLRRDVLQDLIDRELMIERFAAIGGTIPQEFINDHIQKTIDGPPYNGDKTAFDKILADRGVSLAQYGEHIRNRAIVFYMKEVHSSSVAYSFYQEHPDLFPMDDRWNLTVLVLVHEKNVDISKDPVYSLAKQVDQAAKSGISLNDMPTRYSKNLKGQKAGVFTVWVTPDENDSDFPKAPEQVEAYSFIAGEWPLIQKLQPGQVSDVFQAPDNSYFIVQMNEHRPARIAMTEETKEQKKNLIQAIQDTNMKSWLKDLRESAHIEIF